MTDSDPSGLDVPTACLYAGFALAVLGVIVANETAVIVAALIAAVGGIYGLGKA